MNKHFHTEQNVTVIFYIPDGNEELYDHDSDPENGGNMASFQKK